MNNEGLPGMFSHNILHWLETLLFLSPSLGRNIHEMIQLSLEGNEYRPKLCTRLVSFLSCLTRSGTLAVQLAIGFPPSSLFIQEALTCVISMSVKPYGAQTQLGNNTGTEGTHGGELREEETSGRASSSSSSLFFPFPRSIFSTYVFYAQLVLIQR